MPCGLLLFSSMPRRLMSTTTATVLRNIGIMAHIDAGKTTVTERMLFYSGAISRMGNVDTGDTTTDFMDQERERGITISAAAVTIDWDRAKINLIDTPGHVDFSIEVERAVRVLDGGIGVLDAKAGVQAQTETVWRQASKHKVPMLAFLNKMDKDGADVARTLADMREKLGINPLMTQLPLFNDMGALVTADSAPGAGCFVGIIDIISQTALTWGGANGDNVSRREMSPEMQLAATAARTHLIDSLVDIDESLAAEVLGGSDIDYNLPAKKVQDALRRATIARKAVPVLCGSALKNTGIQALLDSVIEYLPSPDDVPPPTTVNNKTLGISPDGQLVALAFKVQNRDTLGPLVFFRVYSGILHRRDVLFNINRGEKEKMTRLLSVKADHITDTDEFGPGSIGAAAGLKLTRTGDTLTVSTKDNKTIGPELQLKGVEIPEPVVVCSIEAESASVQDRLDEILAAIEREDPSIRVQRDPETGQTLLAGLGELHLEVTHQRIKRDYGLDSTVMGPVRIAYRETVTTDYARTDPVAFDRMIGSKRHFASACVDVAPADMGTGVTINIKDRTEPSTIPPLTAQWIRAGALAAANRGVILGYPMVDLAITVHSLTIEPGQSTETAVTGAVRDATLEALRNASPRLLEPVMDVTFTLPEPHVGPVINDLSSRRRGRVIDIESKDHRASVIHAEVPLAEMVGYATPLRSITSGEATFEMKIAGYAQMSEIAQKNIMLKMRGF